MFGIIKRNFYIFIIILVAFLVRFIGIFHDLPYSYFGDEEHFIKRAVSFGSGDLNPHWFHKPALYMYILFFEYGIYYIVGRIIGWFNTVDDFARYYFTDLSKFLIIGRATTALFGTATVYFTYVMGKKIYNNRIGIISSIFLTFVFGNIYYSQVVKADVPATLFSIISIIFIISMLDTHSIRDYLFAGFFAGLGAATKYYTIVLLPPMYLAHLIYNRKENISFKKRIVDVKIFSGFLSFCTGFFFGSPYNFIDTYWFKVNIFPKILDLFSIRDSNLNIENGNKLWNIMENILITIKNYFIIIISNNGMGLMLGIVSIIGVIYIISRLDKKMIIIFCYMLIFFFMAGINGAMYPSSRHMSILYPILCLFAALSIERFTSKYFYKFNISNLYKNIILSFICFLIILPGIYRTIRYDYRSLHEDTRLLAKKWFENNIKPGTKIVLGENGPKLKMSKENIEQLYSLAKLSVGLGSFSNHIEEYYKYQLETIKDVTYDIAEINKPWWYKRELESGLHQPEGEKDLDMGNPIKKRGVMPFEYYQEHGYEYVIVTSLDYEEYFREPMRSNFPSIHHFYQNLFEKGKLVKEFRPNSWKRPGPVVKIFKIGLPRERKAYTQWDASQNKILGNHSGGTNDYPAAHQHAESSISALSPRAASRKTVR